jgi:2-dehydro-3-deoxy-D-arabinonate dehydratase
MKLCRFWRPDRGNAVGVVVGDEVYDLSAADADRYGSFTGLIHSEDLAEELRNVIPRAGSPCCSWSELDRPALPDMPHLLAPITRQEVWAAGVTYLRSRDARMGESPEGGSFYDKVYHAARPEIFFKATAHRVSAPHEPVRIRRDSRWNVPEPELVLVVNRRGALAGFTIGNDMSSRDIEGENPLYLPQAKVYKGCCALGPAVVPAGAIEDARALAIGLQISRGGTIVFEGKTSIAQMKRNFGELIEYLFREQEFPDGVLLMTGTGLVPPDSFTLQSGDVVEITVPEIGTLRNPVA